jgi:hypothetical protein
VRAIAPLGRIILNRCWVSQAAWRVTEGVRATFGPRGSKKNLPSSRSSDSENNPRAVEPASQQGTAVVVLKRSDRREYLADTAAGDRLYMKKVIIYRLVTSLTGELQLVAEHVPMAST